MQIATRQRDNLVTLVAAQYMWGQPGPRQRAGQHDVRMPNWFAGAGQAANPTALFLRAVVVSQAYWFLHVGPAGTR